MEELEVLFLVKAYIDEKLVGHTWFYHKADAEDFVLAFEDLNKNCCAFIEEEWK